MHVMHLINGPKRAEQARTGKLRLGRCPLRAASVPSHTIQAGPGFTMLHISSWHGGHVDADVDVILDALLVGASAANPCVLD